MGVTLGEGPCGLEVRVCALEVVGGDQNASEIDARRHARRQIAGAVDVREQLLHELGDLARGAHPVHRRRQLAQPGA